jgi:hypothetical protein
MKNSKFNPRNTGKIGKKRSEAFKIKQSRRLRGKKKSLRTRQRMSVAAYGRWASPEYRKKHSEIMKNRWAVVKKAQKIIAQHR